MITMMLMSRGLTHRRMSICRHHMRFSEIEVISIFTVLSKSTSGTINQFNTFPNSHNFAVFFLVYVIWLLRPDKHLTTTYSIGKSNDCFPLGSSTDMASISKLMNLLASIQSICYTTRYHVS